MEKTNQDQSIDVLNTIGYLHKCNDHIVLLLSWCLDSLGLISTSD